MDLLQPLIDSGWRGIVVLVGAALVALYAFFRILYSVMWRAFRRAVHELRNEDLTAASWYDTKSNPPKHARPGNGAPLRNEPGPRDW